MPLHIHICICALIHTFVKTFFSEADTGVDMDPDRSNSALML